MAAGLEKRTPLQPAGAELRLHQVALLAVAIGSTVGILASVFAWFAGGKFAATTFFTSLWAIGLAYPVHCKYRKLLRADLH